ncbi:His-Xaa-Ser repeat protein HxsA2 [Methylophilus sp. 5]|uniref:His-Xaa-Ser repeat protein HxsA2 n=1 Tax=Methylophilus sp. 5 TaxID=1112274 RepID=UPI0012FC85D6|nr:His-Xaa-Ser repeat protein HxsA2 [Methylophilus sp. 5]
MKRKYLLPLAVLASALTANQSNAKSVDNNSIDEQAKSNLLEIETEEVNKFDFGDKTALKFILKPNSDGIFYAAHYSHSSHSSHSSHRSHSSGY